LFVFLVVEHRRREVLHFNVTDPPHRDGLDNRLSRHSPTEGATLSDPRPGWRLWK
jgi:hypothetical protein